MGKWGKIESENPKTKKCHQDTNTQDAQRTALQFNNHSEK